MIFGFRRAFLRTCLPSCTSHDCGNCRLNSPRKHLSLNGGGVEETASQPQFAVRGPALAAMRCLGT